MQGAWHPAFRRTPAALVVCNKEGIFCDTKHSWATKSVWVEGKQLTTRSPSGPDQPTTTMLLGADAGGCAACSRRCSAPTSSPAAVLPSGASCGELLWLSTMSCSRSGRRVREGDGQ